MSDEISKVMQYAWKKAGEYDSGPSLQFVQDIRDYIEKEKQEAYKKGFYVGQAMAGVELENCHQNWKKHNEEDKDE